MENIDWNLVLKILSFITATILSIAGLFNYSKKNSISINQKNNSGKINMNKNDIINEIKKDSKV